jgi:hypothetical protein
MVMHERAAPETDEWAELELNTTLTLVTYRIFGPETPSRHTSIWDTAGTGPRLSFHQGTPILER